LHLEKLSCTACHSGPEPDEQARQIQTAMAHGLGLPSHDYSADLAPGIVSPVMQQREGQLYPHRAFWPAFWGFLQDDQIAPLHPEETYDTLRRTLRVRRGSTLAETISDVRLSRDDKASALGEGRASVAESELNEDELAKLAQLKQTKTQEAWQEKLAAALGALKDAVSQDGATPVYVGGGKAYRLKDDGSVESFEHAAANAYVWPLGHDVRPARQSLGVKGCTECHSVGSPIFEGQVAALGPAPDDERLSYAMHQLAGYDKTRLDAWSQSFQGRKAFKWFGFTATGVAGLVLLSYLAAGITALPGRIRRRLR
jgi:hypothetical protein